MTPFVYTRLCCFSGWLEVNESITGWITKTSSVDVLLEQEYLEPRGGMSTLDDGAGSDLIPPGNY
jgi:hypothetical protein